jgi:hypothetical protein
LGLYNPVRNPNRRRNEMSRQARGLLALCAALIATELTAMGGIYHVRPDGSGNGSSWPTASGNLQATADGGGFFCDFSGEPTLRRCVFNLNTGGFRGGGAFFGGDVELVGCTFHDNETEHGGALITDGTSSVVTDCEFRHNWAATYGGGIGGSGALRFSDCSFSYNVGRQGGALSLAEDTDCTIARCVFSRNEVFYNGYGCTGGGIHADRATLRITDSLFIGNSAAGLRSGQLVGSGVAISCTYGNVATTNCTLDENDSGRGAAVELSWCSTARVVNCTLSRNETQSGHTSSFSDGNCSTLDVINTIIWSASQRTISTPQEERFLHCVISTSNTNNWGAGCLFEHPRLHDLADNGGPTQTCALKTNSPALDAGMTGAHIPAVDQRGKPRDASPDIGAYELQRYTVEFDIGATDAGSRFRFWLGPHVGTFALHYSPHNPTCIYGVQHRSSMATLAGWTGVDSSDTRPEGDGRAVLLGELAERYGALRMTVRRRH